MDIFFQTSVLSYIVCFFIKHIYDDNPQWWYFRNSLETLQESSTATFVPFSFVFTVHTDDLQLLFNNRCVAVVGLSGTALYLYVFFKAFLTLSLLDCVLTIMKYTGPVVFFCKIQHKPPKRAPYTDLSVQCHDGNIDLWSGLKLDLNHHQLRVVFFLILCYFRRYKKKKCNLPNFVIEFSLCLCTCVFGQT